ncbi:MAG: helix-turn-helix transcriptional regulator [Clostridia bacterium]|nr:helix-turn-helix transcriptional regulator [Clostridia bacterium]
MELSDKLLALRKQKGLTLEEVAKYVGVGRSTVKKWESGAIRNMRRDKISKLAECLGVTPAYLTEWGGEDAELEEYLEELKARPEMRMLFSLAKDATKEDVERAVAIIEALAKSRSRS